MKKILSNFYILVVGGLLCTAVACKKDNNETPVANKISPDSASGGSVLTVTGSGLSDLRSVVFDNGNVPAVFNPNFNTGEAVIFRVPDTAYGGEQHIVFTKANGQSTKIPFKVIAVPTVSDASCFNFTTGSELTITGNNLESVSEVKFTGTTTPIEVLSKSKRSMTIRMPATDLNRSKLDITNESGGMTTTQEFVNLDKAFKIFTDGYAPGFENASWGDAAFISSLIYKSGTKSVGKKYAAGNWHLIGFGWTNINKLTDYTYLSFYIKGASVDYPLWIMTSATPGSFNVFNDNQKIDVPANVWTYFKIPLSQLDLWATGNSFNQIGWRIKGPEGQDETFYLDDVIFVK